MRITAEQALARVRQSKASKPGGMMKARAARPVGAEDALVRTVKKDSEDMVYLFRDEGTVIVTPADDVIQPVLAEFEVDGDDMVICQPALEWLTMMAEEVKWNQENDYPGYPDEEEEQGNTGTMDTEKELIEPLLGGIQWNQKMPYNRYNNYTTVAVPKGEQVGAMKTCVVGCVATALAQVLLCLHRKGYGVGCLATSDYISNESRGYRFNVPGAQRTIKFDFDNMLDSYSHYVSETEVKQDTYTDEQADAAAKLCMHLGRALKMWYSPKVSLAFTEDLPKVLEKGIGIKATYYGEYSALTSTHINIIKQSLRNGYPVIMAGGGHCFVCDGYREEDNTFHFNWGMGPDRTDGWFTITTFKWVEGDNIRWKRDYESYQNKRKFIILDMPQSRVGWRAYDLNHDGYINPSDLTEAILIMNAIKVNANLISSYRRAGCNIRPIRRTPTQSTVHEYVDLGLPSGTLWATCNIGAESPEDFEEYISWGETEGKNAYDWSDYSHCDGTPGTCHDLGSDIAGTQYDAAAVRWGDGWQMPSQADWQELIDNCDFKLVYSPSLTGDNLQVDTLNYQYIKVTRKLTQEQQQEYQDNDIEPPSIILPLSGFKWPGHNPDSPRIKGRYWMSDAHSSRAYAYAMELTFTRPDNSIIADLNYDGIVDTADLQAIIDRILNR